LTAYVVGELIEQRKQVIDARGNSCGGRAFRYVSIAAMRDVDGSRRAAKVGELLDERLRRSAER
jgi:hypothetical protein